MLWLLHKVVHPFITVAFPKCHRMLSVGDDQTAFRCDAVRHFLTIPQDQAGHVVPIVIEPVQQIHKRRLDPTNPQRFGNKNELLFHLSNLLFSGRIISNAPRNCDDSTSKSTGFSGSLMQSMSWHCSRMIRHSSSTVSPSAQDTTLSVLNGANCPLATCHHRHTH